MKNNPGVLEVSFRVCIACHFGIRAYPYMGFMVGQQFELPGLSRAHGHSARV